ncbi:MAG: hypothetical protein ACFFC6_13480 [Promethearchaeota archaeon]
MRKSITKVCMIGILGILFFSFTFLILNSTEPKVEIKYQKTFGGVHRDGAYSLIQTSVDGFILAGFTRSDGAGNSDSWRVKTDANGEMLWNRTYGGPENDKARTVIQTNDGGFLVVGSTFSYGNGGEDVWLIKTDSNGLVLWNRTYGGTHLDIVRSMIQTIDGGFVLAGFTIKWLDLAGLGNGGADIWIMKIDTRGNLQWNHTYHGGKDERIYSIIQTLEGGFALAGRTTVTGDFNSEIWLVKTDAFGQIEWNQTYQGVEDEWVYSLIQTSDKGFILAGINQTQFSSESDIVILKTNAYGNVIWSKTYGNGGSSNECTYNLLQTPDGGFAFAGYIKLYGTSRSDVLFTKIDKNGVVEWIQIIGEEEPELAYSLLDTSDGGFAIAGISEASDMGEGDMWLLKTHPLSGVISLAPGLNYWGIIILSSILLTLRVVIRKQRPEEANKFEKTKH